ncbi:MAG: proline--tRNA ligase [Planctomycetes bacterium]|nr:proline--tRNA ligase [Planctomycetota bacterium]MCB9919856.1 proline--tRNA ligase [Planctomycetota bacterium]
MRLSTIPLATLREDPADAEVPSHRLLARAGYIQKIAAGIYVYSPLMWRTLRKVSNIVREELEREGAHEILMPILQPKEIWEQSGRWARYLAEGLMFHMVDKRGSEVCLGPTHEEVVTTYIKRIIKSYKQLPINVYQIQDKFRDEIRPRFGLMRGREFLMKDAYSFDIDEAGLDASYRAMDRAYRRIFERCGLAFRAVEADSGAIGGSGSQEFMVLAETGEDAILYCEESGYAANVEKATSIITATPDGGAPKELEKHETPGIKTVDQLVQFFGMEAARMAKTVIYNATYADRVEPIAVMMRGDLEINEVKLCGIVDALAVGLADEETVKRVTGADVGFAGPIGLQGNVRLIADLTLEGATNLLTGCCETGYHCLNVNPGRDCPKPDYRDVRLARAGERSPDDKGALVETRGIEVGHIFKLGTKYSSAMDATFIAEDGKPTPFVMGCYGIGVSRTAASAVEQNHDDSGIVWPRPIAPFEVVVAILDAKRSEQVELGEKLYTELVAAGIDTCLDDRKMSPGAKFKDLDLLGFPLRVVVGRRAGEWMVEFSHRATGDKADILAAEVLDRVRT